MCCYSAAFHTLILCLEHSYRLLPGVIGGPGTDAGDNWRHMDEFNGLPTLKSEFYSAEH